MEDVSSSPAADSPASGRRQGRVPDALRLGERGKEGEEERGGLRDYGGGGGTTEASSGGESIGLDVKNMNKERVWLFAGSLKSVLNFSRPMVFTFCTF